MKELGLPYFRLFHLSDRKMQNWSLYWNPSHPDIIPPGNASFIVNPTLACCGINYSCSVFSRDRKTHQRPCVSTWRLLLSCPMTCILLVLKTRNSHRPSSGTLFTNHWIISTAAFLLYLSVIFKLDVKVHYECKLGALSFGWICFAS